MNNSPNTTCEPANDNRAPEGLRHVSFYALKVMAEIFSELDEEAREKPPNIQLIWVNPINP